MQHSYLYHATANQNVGKPLYIIFISTPPNLTIDQGNLTFPSGHCILAGLGHYKYKSSLCWVEIDSNQNKKQKNWKIKRFFSATEQQCRTSSVKRIWSDHNLLVLSNPFGWIGRHIFRNSETAEPERPLNCCFQNSASIT